ncbi:RnfABCDGE type electron transport complex subunit B [Verrucomicrobiota bacterium]
MEYWSIGMMGPLITGGVLIGSAGLVCAIALSAAAKIFIVHEDPKISRAVELLPGANCGGCGFAGCADYAKAIVVDAAAINLCAPGGNDVIKSLAELMGVEASSVERKVAIVLCGGGSSNAPRKFAYNGVADCSAANSVAGGDKACRYGCLGYGGCARVCPTGAIEIKDNLAVVHPDSCIGCGACVKACPRNLIELIPDLRKIHVLCSSKDKGPVVKKACKVGCIGCTVCAKLAENEAINMDGFLAVVDYSKELDNDKVVEKCPGKCIVKNG